MHIIVQSLSGYTIAISMWLPRHWNLRENLQKVFIYFGGISGSRTILSAVSFVPSATHPLRKSGCMELVANTADPINDDICTKEMW